MVIMGAAVNDTMANCNEFELLRVAQPIGGWQPPQSLPCRLDDRIWTQAVEFQD